MAKKTHPNKSSKVYGLKAFRPIRLLACSTLFLFLAGCGGGGAGETGISGNLVSSEVSGASVGTGPGKVSLSWEAPTTNADGTTLVDLAGFKVYYGITSPISKENSKSIDVDNKTDYTVSGFDIGTYYFAVTAYDISGNESDLSEEVSKEIREG